MMKILVPTDGSPLSLKAARIAARLAQRLQASIIATACAHKCELIVMASHGRGGMRKLLLGSETTKVLLHSEIPVLVCR